MLAELQVFTGSTLDTNDEDNRRAFVSANGKPVPADEKAGIDGAGNVIPKGSIQLMGRRPDIMLHGSSDWIKGRNTGSSGIDGEGHVLPDGQFTPEEDREIHTGPEFFQSRACWYAVMLVCSISTRARQRAISASVAETAEALDSPGTGNVVFATLVDDPASVADLVDAYLGEIMQEAANATDSFSAGMGFAVGVDKGTVAQDFKQRDNYTGCGWHRHGIRPTKQPASA